MKPPTTHLKLVIDGKVSYLPGGKASETAARNQAHQAIMEGARYLDLYRAPVNTTDWVLLRHFEPLSPPAYFKATAERIAKTGTASPFALPTQAHAEHLMDCLFLQPRGTITLRTFSDHLPTGSTRSMGVLQVFDLRVRRVQDESVFSVFPEQGKLPQLLECLRAASAPHPATLPSTPHYTRAGRRRQRSLSR